MMKITPEDLVRYLYKETSDLKTAHIKEALQINPHIRDEFEKIKYSQAKLDDVKVSPRQDTINKIMEYAAKKHNQLHSI